MNKFLTFLVLAMILMGCPNDNQGSGNHNPDNGNPITATAQGKVIILQAYGSSTNAEGASHSFVELYNISDEDITLNGIGLYYADGTTVASAAVPNTATEDGAWARISLDGKTIPAGGSFLILGPKESPTAARYQIPDNYGDINDPDFSLSNRAFKVALIKSTAELTAQNPFTDGDSDQPVSGYIDMVGAANDYEGRDLIFGFETAPARNSASEAVRRGDLLDTDDNSADFIAARYASTGAGAFSDEELEVRKPRNSSAGAWQPFAAPEEPTPPENPTVAGTQSALAGQLLILQVYGTGTATDGAVSHSFIELYNNTENPVNLNTYSLQYANTTGTNWTVINLTGTIPAKGSYLVRGNNNNTSGRLHVGASDQDAAFYLDNGNFKVALMANQNTLTVANPFAMTGGKAKDYVDLVGVKNGNSDNIDAYEAALAQVISKQAAARRKNLTDTNNNSTDFERIDYRTTDLDRYKPRSSSNGTWDPFEEPEGTAMLMILQVFGMHANNDSAPTHSFIELYNNTGNAINLSGYSVHWANGNSTNNNAPSEKDVWYKIDLTGSIPARSSYLILGPQVVDATTIANTSTNGRLDLTDLTADKTSEDFLMSNRSYKVALMSNQVALTAANPWGDAACIDMVSAINTSGTDSVTAAKGNDDLTAVNAASGAAKTISKQKAFRRTSLSVTDSTLTDFTSIQYSTISVDDIAKFRPRTTSDGVYDPQF